ncbi:hypothetical protein U91I_01595 [alpha proteobacterium U9-1i]|nr:hypothetical protein U91I_01595 [alpha proteobacterium U9-1i]
MSKRGIGIASIRYRQGDDEDLYRTLLRSTWLSIAPFRENDAGV